LTAGPETSSRRELSIIVSIIIAELAFAILAGALLADASARRGALENVATEQNAPLASLHRVRMQLDRLGRGTAALASQGDRNAQAVIAELRQRGVAINPDAAPVAP
jgi:hypothetical protein